MDEKLSISAIAKNHGISRPAIYRIMRNACIDKQGKYTQKQLKHINDVVTSHVTKKASVIVLPNIDTLAVTLDLSIDERLAHNRNLYKKLIEARKAMSVAIAKGNPAFGIKDMQSIVAMTATLDKNITALERERGEQYGKEAFDPFA